MAAEKSLDISYIGQRIKYIRKNILSLSQVEFRVILNTTQANISYLENESRQSELTIKAYIYFVSKGINLEWIIIPDNSNISIYKDDIL
jgi:DNA-binding transcriptional regulator YiaG